MAAASPNLGTGPTNQQGPSPQTGSTTPTGQIIGPLPASTMPGQVAQTVPVMANFQFLLNAINNLAAGGSGTVTQIKTTLPITGGPITTTGTIGHANSGVNAGTYGDTTHVPVITVDSFGHVDNVSVAKISGGGGISSPLTTKGDVWGYSTTDARIPVGADNLVLTADSTQALGVKWATGGGSTPFNWGKYIAGLDRFPIG